MKVGNAFVRVVLESPFHRVLSGSTDLVRYHGRRTGELHVTPTQYAPMGDDLVILVARADTKTWWRNFRRPRDLDVLVAGRWRPMTARVVTGADEPAEAERLLRAYLDRFPKAARVLDGETLAAQAHHATLVWCRPRP